MNLFKLLSLPIILLIIINILSDKYIKYITMSSYPSIHDAYGGFGDKDQPSRS